MSRTTRPARPVAPAITALLLASACANAAACTSSGDDTPRPPEAGDDTSAEVDDDGESGDGGEDGGREDAGGEDAAAVDPACGGAESVVRFDTEDGVTLVADYRPGPTPASPVVVLFHMIPPSWDRGSYPARVRDALAATGAAVLTVDRRGAGDSSGVARDAYEGPGGRLDAEAAARFLAGAPCPPDLGRAMWVGASNGTTSVMDYTVAHADALPAPARVAWLSPGTYTETQHAIADHADVLDATPLLVVYPDSEPWADALRDAAPELWRFERNEGGAHGTQNFDQGANEAAQLGALVSWAEAL